MANSPVKILKTLTFRSVFFEALPFANETISNCFGIKLNPQRLPPDNFGEIVVAVQDVIGRTPDRARQRTLELLTRPDTFTEDERVHEMLQYRVEFRDIVGPDVQLGGPPPSGTNVDSADSLMSYLRKQAMPGFEDPFLPGLFGSRGRGKHLGVAIYIE